MSAAPDPACVACGACCFALHYPPFNLHGEQFAQLQREHPDLAAEVLRAAASRAARPGPCPWLDPATRRCRHYELRPQICRDFLPRSPKCLELRWMHGIAEPLDRSA